MENNSRRKNGMFKPGISGNPTGRPKSDVTIKDLAKQYTEQAINTLYEITQNKKAPHSARVHAACALLDRGWGKPTQSIESTSVRVTYQNFLETCRIADEEEALSHENEFVLLDYNPVSTYESMMRDASEDVEVLFNEDFDV